MRGKTLFRKKQFSVVIVIFCFLNRISGWGKEFYSNGTTLRTSSGLIIAGWHQTNGDYRIIMPQMSIDFGKKVERVRKLIRKTRVLEKITVIEEG